MADYKFILLFVSLHCALVVEGTWKEFFLGKQGGSHSIKRGERSKNPQDSELYNQIIENTDQPFMQGYINGEYCYPSKDTIDDNPPIVITMFETFDMEKGGKNSGEVFEQSGGVGKNQVCIYIESQFGGTYKYKFKVYGYKKNAAA